MTNSNLPENWKETKLKDICDVVRGASPRPKGDPRFYGGSIPRLMIADVTRDGIWVTPQIDFLTEEGAKLSRPMNRGDLILSISGTVGLPCFLAVNACIHDGFIGLKDLSSDVVSEFLFFQLLFWRDKLNMLAPMGSIFKNLTTDIVKEFPIALPSQPEQCAIARVLRAVQEAKEARQKELMLERERKAALMQHLFTHGTCGEPTKRTEIGEMPKSWQIVKLESLSSLITKGSSPNWQGFEYCDEGIIFVRSQNVGLGRLELEEVACLPEAFNQKEKKSIIRSNDLLINIVGASIGRAAVANEFVEGGNLNQAVALVRLKEHNNPAYLMGFLLSESGQSQLHRQKKDIARANLSLQDIGNLLVPLLAEQEQTVITDVLSGCDGKIEALEKESALLDELFHSLLEELMTGRLSAAPLVESVE